MFLLIMSWLEDTTHDLFSKSLRCSDLVFDSLFNWLIPLRYHRTRFIILDQLRHSGENRKSSVRFPPKTKHFVVSALSSETAD